MPNAREAIARLPYDGKTISLLYEIFDEVWASMSDVALGGPDARESERRRLAGIIFELAQNPQFNSLQIAAQAAKRMRREA